MTSKRCRLAVLASGRGSNFRAIAQSCQREDFPAEIACLITDNATSGAIAGAEALSIPVSIVDAGKRRGRLADGVEEGIADICETASVDFILLAGFMRILSGPMLDRFAGRIINIHPSLLPSFPGLHAQRQALEFGARIAGCTVHFVDASVDGGPIILQAAVPVFDDDDVESLRERILGEEHRVVSRAVELLATGRLRIEGRRVLGDDDIH